MRLENRELPGGVLRSRCNSERIEIFLLIRQSDGNSDDRSRRCALCNLHHESAMLADDRRRAGEDAGGRVLRVEARIEKMNRHRTSRPTLRQRRDEEMFEVATQARVCGKRGRSYRAFAEYLLQHGNVVSVD